MTASDSIPTLEQLKQRESLDREATRWRARSAADGSSWRLQRLPCEEGLQKSVEHRVAAWSGIAHPALLKPVVSQVEDDALWVIRPWVDSGPQPQTPDEALGAAQRLAEALAQLHDHGFAHGRVSDGNVLFPESGGLRLTDFALDSQSAPAEDLQDLARLLCEWLFDETPVTADAETVDQWLVFQAARHPLPPRLGRLLHRLLCRNGGLSALQVRNRLDDIRLSLKRGDQAARHLWEVDSYVAQRPRSAAAPAGAATSPPGESRAHTYWPWIALAVLVMVIGMGLLWKLLPAATAPDPVAQVAAPELQQAAAETLDPTPQPPSQYELEMMLRHRDAAQAELDALINLQLELEEQEVAQWAPQAFEAARRRAREGDEPFRAQQFERAAQVYSDAHRLLKGVAGLRPLVVGEALERGRLALEERRSEQAQAAFELALAIEPDHELAAAGLARAQVMDELMALLDGAREAMESGALEQARDLYSQAADLDPRSEAAAQGKAQANAAIGERDFRAAMSEGLAALQAQRWQAAESALRRAQRLRPGAQAPADALVELQRQRRDASVASARALARKAVAEERWEAAIKHFDGILERDPNLKFAQEGRAVAADRLDLDQRLAQFTAAPGRWWSQQGRQEARSLLADAQSIESRGTRLVGQIRTLARQIELAEQPVVITLRSDNACDVVVYKVARLGRFDSHQLRLLPGRYTAVGTRDGYRDVRREFIVPAGRAPAPVVLRCEEQVLAGG